MEQQDVRPQQVGLATVDAMRLANEAKLIRDREQAREIFLTEWLQQRRREQENVHAR